MKYYFKYKVVYKDYLGKNKTVLLRADNPPHLVQRFRKKYPRGRIIKFSPCEE